MSSRSASSPAPNGAAIEATGQLRFRRRASSSLPTISVELTIKKSQTVPVAKESSMPRSVALMLIHGMGQQQTYELTNAFVRNLSDAYSDQGQAVQNHPSDCLER